MEGWSARTYDDFQHYHNKYYRTSLLFNALLVFYLFYICEWYIKVNFL